MTETIPILNVMSGVVYELPADEVINTASYEIPLLKPFDRNCKTCHGRGYRGFNDATQQYEVCPRCGRKCVNYELYKTLSMHRKSQSERFLKLAQVNAKIVGEHREAQKRIAEGQ